MSKALDALYGCVVDDSGRRWGSIACAEQKADAASLLDPEAERFQLLIRPRGGSKTTDLAAVLAVVLAFQAGPSDRLYAFGSDRDQAALIHDFIAQISRRTAALRGLEIGTHRVRAPSGATLQVMSADSSSAFGILPSWVAADELAWWPPSHEKLWTAITSAMGKKKGSRLTIISAPSSPSHWSHKVYRHAQESPAWRVSHWSPGKPLPWVDESYLEEQRVSLTEHDYRRLHLAEWAEGGGGLAIADDVLAACHLDGPIPREAGRSYVVSVDAGIVRDRTAAAVAHLYQPNDGNPSRVVVDRLAVWKGSKQSPVDLSEVQAWIEQAHESYGRPRVVTDPWQMIGTAQQLRKKGVRVREFSFSAGASKLAGTIYSLLRERRLDLPNDPELVEELQSVRIVETSPGRMRLDNPAGSHDDRVVSIALAAVELLDKTDARAPYSVNRKDLESLESDPVLERSGMTLRGKQFLDRAPGGRLVAPPGWIRRRP